MRRKKTVLLDDVLFCFFRRILNETEIREDESFKFESVEDSGKYTLVIKEAKSDMTGNLTCEAKNEKGKDSCTGSVTVKCELKFRVYGP